MYEVDETIQDNKIYWSDFILNYIYILGDKTIVTVGHYVKIYVKQFGNSKIIFS